MFIAANCSWSFVYCSIIWCVFLLRYVYYFTMCIVVVHNIAAALLARSQYPEVPVTGDLDTGFPHVYKQTLRRFPTFQVATTCSPCSPPNLNLLDPYFILMYVHNSYCHRVTIYLQINYCYYYYY